MVVSDVLPHWTRELGQALGPLASCLRAEGVNLVELEDAKLDRGTPVFVEADAPALEVQRLMARHHVRMVPVLKGQEILGVVDLVDMVAQSELLTRSASVSMLATRDPHGPPAA